MKNIACISSILTLFLAGLPTAGLTREQDVVHIDERVAESGVRFRVDLINEMIKNPRSANVKNWREYIGGPHDEREFAFLLNSIGNGTLAGEMPSKRRSDEEQSVLLQYLRLTLMAYNIRRGDVSQYLTLSSVHKKNYKVEETGLGFSVERSAYVAKGDLVAADACGELVRHPLSIEFDVVVSEPEHGKRAEPNKLDIHLYKIEIEGRAVYGWWYSVGDCTKPK